MFQALGASKLNPEVAFLPSKALFLSMAIAWNVERLGRSVIAVPPLARDASGKISASDNEKIVTKLRSGGIEVFLYGGNAILYHVSPGEYSVLCEMLSGFSRAGEDFVPAVGPGFGMMMEQAKILRGFDFPTAMVLPTLDMAKPSGVASGIRRFAEALGKPVVVYLKFEGYLDLSDLQALVEDGVVAWVKYAVVREDPSEDDLLKELVDRIGPDGVVSGMGEQPATVHLQDFGLCGFTSGCVCVAPALSTSMLKALKRRDIALAEEIRTEFRPLEDLRNGIHPVSVLHSAVELSEIASTGPLLPLLEPPEESALAEIRRACLTLMEKEKARISAVDLAEGPMS